MIISSKALNDLNKVTIKVVDKENAIVGALFADAENPLYLVDSSLPAVTMQVQTTDLWESSKQIMGKVGMGIVQGLAAQEFKTLGNWNAFSGCIDLRSKFIMSGSAPQEFELNCMIVNRRGWSESIAPQLNELARWVLPSVIVDGSGKPVAIGDGLYSKVEEGYNKHIENNPELSKDLYSLFQYLNVGITAIKDWVGAAQLLSMPKQFGAVNKATYAELQVGRLKFRDVFIKSVSIQLPRTFMKNENGELEPDCVNIHLGVKSCRQTTLENLKF